ncbi:MAG: exo-beta-N-acetylmuramidase NamZ family protein [Flavobacteriaceae bacterium]
MKLKFIKNTVLLFVVVLLSCGNRTTVKNESFPIVGANQLALYLPFLDGKNIGVVANQTTVIFKNNKELTGAHTHLVDSLLKLGIKIKKVFAPEHGYRGKADAGEYVKDGVDIKTGLPIVSLYGANRKPNPEILRDLDVVIFDVQDVGARFYTFVSTLHYMMETCATLNIPILILDRPNPNGHYIDGPILDLNHKSFVGMHPVPVVHGMTIGEYAKMINGEGWLENGIQCELKIISVANYYHKKTYNLPIKPSPNLPNSKAVNLYSSLCFFEGTNVSSGRGTSTQFQVYGSPFLNSEKYNYVFTPKPNLGAKNPMHNGVKCFGKDLTDTEFLSTINLEWLIDAYNNTSNKSDFFNPFFTKLAGQTQLQQQIESGTSANDIRESWQKELEAFKKIRANYLLYP